jgi:hypothetical protein
METMCFSGKARRAWEWQVAGARWESGIDACGKNPGTVQSAAPARACFRIVIDEHARAGAALASSQRPTLKRPLPFLAPINSPDTKAIRPHRPGAGGTGKGRADVGLQPDPSCSPSAHRVAVLVRNRRADWLRQAAAVGGGLQREGGDNR